MTAGSVPLVSSSGFRPSSNSGCPGLLRLHNNGLVGAARIGPAHDPVEIRLRPKTSIDRLLLLG